MKDESVDDVRPMIFQAQENEDSVAIRLRRNQPGRATLVHFGFSVRTRGQIGEMSGRKCDNMLVTSGAKAPIRRSNSTCSGRSDGDVRILQAGLMFWRLKAIQSALIGSLGPNPPFWKISSNNCSEALRANCENSFSSIMLLSSSI